MNEHLAFLRKRLHYAENDLKSVIASFDVGLPTATDVTNAQKRTDDARRNWNCTRKGNVQSRTIRKPYVYQLPADRTSRFLEGFPKFPQPRQQPIGRSPHS
ncbi:hypothetical protein CEXT_80001 [Caerostris extrusa]|uniref:Uncharacterized protein n=1 Tax=Caerostris extrusa TaxID=172846 RepID=A0AAV4SX30_CAEEX|nr:hypothetical protein CEXT_80001 [Caerostris extrusa]